MNSSSRDFAVSIVTTLRAANYHALFAGGCVRDLLLGKTPADFDVATDATPDDVMRLFRRTVPVGVSFGVIRVIGSKSQGEVEVATFRSDGEYLDGRRPESVTFGSAETDALRRDFTINGMFLDPVTNEVIDYVGGRNDLDGRVIRAIGDPFARFAEDKLRLLRAVRFAARLEFEIESQTADAIRSMASEVTQVSIERIMDEWRKMIVPPTRVRALTMARELGLLQVLISGLSEESWIETIRVLNALPNEPGFPLAMAALLRKLGVAATVRDWKLSNSDRDRIVRLIEAQDALLNPDSLPRSRLKRILASPEINELLDLHESIALATTGDWTHVNYCRRYLRELPDGPIDPPPLVTGRDLIEAGLKPGPRFSGLLEKIRDAQLDGVIQTKEDGIKLIAEDV